MAFPESPINNQKYGDYFYDATVEAWRYTGNYVGGITLDQIVDENVDEYDVSPSETAHIADIEKGTLEFTNGLEVIKKEPIRVPGTIGNSMKYEYSFFKMVPMGENNLIENGNCESLTSPRWTGEVPAGSFASTFERSSDYAFSGTYSYKFTTLTTDFAGSYLDSSSSYHGLNQGDIIRIELMAYVPTQAGVDTTNVRNFILVNSLSYSNLGPQYKAHSVTKLNTWQKLVLYFQLPNFVTFTGFRTYLQVNGVPTNSVMYVDEIKIWKLEFSRPSIYFSRFQSSQLTSSAGEDLMSTFWVTSATYHVNKRLEYDDELGDIVHVWNRGSSLNSTYIFQNLGLTVESGIRNFGCFIWCSIPITVQSYVYGPEVVSPLVRIPANTWFFYQNHFTIGAAGTGVQLVGIFPQSGNFLESDVIKCTRPITQGNTVSNVPKKLESGACATPTPYVVNAPTPPVGTFMCWLKPGFSYNVGNNKAIFADFNSSNQDYIYYYYSQANDRFLLNINGSAVAQSSLFDRDSHFQMWRHHAITWNSNTHQYKLYINGELVSSNLATPTAYVERGNMCIGGIPYYTMSTEQYYIDSAMADVLIDTVEWTEDDIRDHYIKGIPWKAREKQIAFDGIFIDENNDLKEIKHNSIQGGGRSWRFQ